MDERWRIFVAEFIGTAVLVLGGVGTAVLAGKDVGFLGIAFAFGLSLLIMAYAIGGISGCHINPAVTMGMWVAKKIPTATLPYYWVAQVLGAIFGALLVFGIASGQAGFSAKASGLGANGFGKHSPALTLGLTTHGYSWWAAFLGEAVVTAMFVFVVISTGRRRFPAVFTGLAIGLALTVAHLIMIPVDGTSVNPARSIGPALFQHTWALRQIWVFILAPLAGGALAAFLWRVLPEREEEIRAAGQPMPETEPGIVGAGPPPPD
jgi:aquaporin Z